MFPKSKLLNFFFEELRSAGKTDSTIRSQNEFNALEADSVKRKFPGRFLFCYVPPMEQPVRNVGKMAAQYCDEWLKMVAPEGTKPAGIAAAQAHFLNGFIAAASALSGKQTLEEWKRDVESQMPSKGKIILLGDK